MADPLNPESSIQSIPENLLLEIFSYLPTRDLCTIGRVCRAWRRVARDNSLWRHVNLQPYKLNLRKTWKVIRAHFSDVLLTLRIRGYMDPGVVSWNKTSLSDAMLNDLQERCPNMTIIDITSSNLTYVSLEQFPKQLNEIRITHSLVPNGWFKPLSVDDAFPELTHIDLTGSTKTIDSDLKDIVAKVKLRSLRLDGSYRITEKGIKDLAEKQTELETLGLSETQCTDLGLQYIGRNLKKLRVFDVSKCQKISDDGVDIICTCHPLLESLNLSFCQGITKGCLPSLLKLKALKGVKLTKTMISAEDASVLGDKLVVD